MGLAARARGAADAAAVRSALRGLGFAACQRGFAVGFVTAAALVHELLRPGTSDGSYACTSSWRPKAADRRRARLRAAVAERGGAFVRGLQPAYQRGSVLVTSNLPFDEWTSVFGSERLTGALLDRLTHHVHILEMNGESYRLKVSRRRQGKAETPTNAS